MCTHDSIRVKHPEYRHDRHPGFSIGDLSVHRVPSHSFHGQKYYKKIRDRRERERVENFPAQNLRRIEAYVVSIRPIVA